LGVEFSSPIRSTKGASSFGNANQVKLLNLLEAILAIFSKCALKSLHNQAGFDSAIRRFDPGRQLPGRAVATGGAARSSARRPGRCLLPQ
jgi:hypothetical protein